MEMMADSGGIIQLFGISEQLNRMATALLGKMFV